MTEREMLRSIRRQRSSYAKAEAENSAPLAAIDKRFGEIDKRLTAEFRDYVAIASPAPISVKD